MTILQAESRSEITELLPKVDALAGFNFLTDEDDLSHIKWIHSFGAGVNTFLKLQKLGQTTVITRTTGDMGNRIGEFCLAHILADAKQLLLVYENQKNRKWQQIPTRDIAESRVLILGTGAIGQGVARQLKAQVRQLTGLNQTGSIPDYFDQVCDWDTIPGEVDVVISTLPDTQDTRSKLDQSFFGHFEKALFINVGRGNVVRQDSLLEAIQSKQIRLAVLDVFAQEPLPKESPLWSNENVLISPHQSGITTIEDVASSFKMAYEALTRGERNPLFVDFDRGY